MEGIYFQKSGNTYKAYTGSNYIGMLSDGCCFTNVKFNGVKNHLQIAYKKGAGGYVKNDMLLENIFHIFIAIISEKKEFIERLNRNVIHIGMNEVVNYKIYLDKI